MRTNLHRDGVTSVTREPLPATYSDMREPIGEHLKYLKRRNCQPGTVRQRGEHLHRFERWLGRPIVQAEADDLETWQRGLTVCASSVQTYTSHLRAFYKWACVTDFVLRDPTLELVIPKTKRRMPRPIPESDLEVALITVRPDHQMFCWFLLAGYCGLRAAEISKVNRTDLRDERSGAGGFLMVHGKGGAERVVRVAPEVMHELARYRNQAGPVFRRTSGLPVTPNEITRRSSEHLAAVGLPYTLHQLRHRFATRLCDLGADIRDVQDAMGHASLTTTSLYLKASGARSAKVIDRLSRGVVDLR